uniref:TIL domain-containing protein n=1 Tax=Syphacia muris TaxID=451379 RepID=A0A0N5A8K4_9BILA
MLPQNYLNYLLILQNLLLLVNATDRRVKVINNAGVRSNNAEILPQTPGERHNLRELYHERFTMTSSNVSEQLHGLKPFISSPKNDNTSDVNKDSITTNTESERKISSLSSQADKPYKPLSNVPVHNPKLHSLIKNDAIIVKKLNNDGNVHPKSANLVVQNNSEQSEAPKFRVSYKTKNAMQSESEEGSDEEGYKTYLVDAESTSGSSESTKKVRRKLPVKKKQQAPNVIILNINGDRESNYVQTKTEKIYYESVPLIQINLFYPKRKEETEHSGNKPEINTHSSRFLNSLDYFNPVSSGTPANLPKNNNMNVDQMEISRPAVDSVANGRQQEVVYETIYRKTIRDLSKHSRNNPVLNSSLNSIKDDDSVESTHDIKETTSAYTSIKPNKSESKCKPTEYWSECGIESTCIGSHNSYKCGKPQCVCKEGLWRDHVSGRCVELFKCPKKQWSTAGGVWIPNPGSLKLAP